MAETIESLTDLLPEMVTLIFDSYTEGAFQWGQRIPLLLEDAGKIGAAEQREHYRNNVIAVLEQGALFFDAEALETDIDVSFPTPMMTSVPEEADYFTLDAAKDMLREMHQHRNSSLTAYLMYSPMQGLLVLLQRLVTWSHVSPRFRAMLRWRHVYETMLLLRIHFDFPPSLWDAFTNPRRGVVLTEEYYRLLILDILTTDHVEPRKFCCYHVPPVFLADLNYKDKINFLKARLTSFAQTTQTLERRKKSACWSHPAVEDAIRAELTACVAAWCVTQHIKTRGTRTLPLRTCRIMGRHRPPAKLLSFMDTMVLKYMETNVPKLDQRHMLPMSDGQVMFQYYDNLDSMSYHSDDDSDGTNLHPPGGFSGLTVPTDYDSYSEDRDGSGGSSSSSSDDDDDDDRKEYERDAAFDNTLVLMEDVHHGPRLFPTRESESQVD
jgi:hypothetical protein